MHRCEEAFQQPVGVEERPAAVPHHVGGARVDGVDGRPRTRSDPELDLEPGDEPSAPFREHTPRGGAHYGCAPADGFGDPVVTVDVGGDLIGEDDDVDV